MGLAQFLRRGWGGAKNHRYIICERSLAAWRTLTPNLFENPPEVFENDHIKLNCPETDFH